MSGSTCWSYLSWYHRASGHWATWEPGADVSPGDVGHFDSELRFRHWRTLHDYGIDFRASRDQVTGPSDILFADSKDFYCRTKVAGKTAHGFASLGELDAGVNISARKQRACILQMRGITESSIADQPGVLKKVAERIRDGEWEIDSVIVMRRLRARGGFAAIFEGPGHDIELKAAGDARVAGLVDLGGVDLRLAEGRSGSKVRFYQFGDRVTPVISQVMQVKKSLWSKLLPWRPMPSPFQE